MLQLVQLNTVGLVGPVEGGWSFWFNTVDVAGPVEHGWFVGTAGLVGLLNPVNTVGVVGPVELGRVMCMEFRTGTGDAGARSPDKRATAARIELSRSLTVVSRIVAD